MEGQLSTRAYKFLRPGRIGPFSGFAWPEPAAGEAGKWVESSTDAGPCRAGVHACERDHLPLWIWEELWEAELAGDVERVAHKLRAPRGRLIRRVDAWSPETAKSFARACAGRAALHASAPLRDAGYGDAAALFEGGTDLLGLRELAAELWDSLPHEAQIPVGMASDGAIRALTATASDDPYVSAHGSAVCAYIAALTALRVGGEAALVKEREWQADRLARELALD